MGEYACMQSCTYMGEYACMQTQVRGAAAAADDDDVDDDVELKIV